MEWLANLGIGVILLGAIVLLSAYFPHRKMLAEITDGGPASFFSCLFQDEMLSQAGLEHRNQMFRRIVIGFELGVAGLLINVGLLVFGVISVGT